MENYLKEEVKYTNYGLYDSSGESPIMMDWETDIMKKSAEVICRNGGDIINIGFGMGIVDTFIESYNIKSHTIIEPHSRVLQKMKSENWYDIDRVTILEGGWRDYIDDLPQYDGIYYDTSPAENYDEYVAFYQRVHKIVKSGGVLSFFNGSYFDPNNKNTPQFIFEIISEHFEIYTEKIPLSYEGYDLSKIERYWSPDRTKYWVPICIRK